MEGQALERKAPILCWREARWNKGCKCGGGKLKDVPSEDITFSEKLELMPPILSIEERVDVGRLGSVEKLRSPHCGE